MDMDTSTWGKVFRISLIVTLVSTIISSIALIITHSVASMSFSSYIDYTVYMPLVYRIICFVPICTLSVISIVFVSLQTKRILALEKIVMKADDIPNNYRFTPPNTTKSNRPLVIKILIITVLAFILVVCILGSEGAIIRIVIDLISSPDVSSSDQAAFRLNIAILVLYALLFISIGLSTLLGGACIFVGGRSAHVDELEKVLIQKSNYAELRAREENDDLDEFSEIF